MSLPRIVAACLLFAPAPLRAASFDVSIPPKDGEKFKSADFRLWLPDGAKTIRAVIVRQHGCGRNGIDHSDDLQWQALAAKHDAALLATWFQQTTKCDDWFDPKNGTERAFFDALKHFGDKSGHPELAAAPWAIWGHSGGSLWACHMTNRHPHRVVAVWGRSQALTEYVDAALRVPIVFNYGEREKTGRFEGVHKNSVKAFETYRPRGAVWAIAVDPKSEHDCRNSRQLAVPFFDKMLAARLPKTGVELRGADAVAWRGHPTTFDIKSPEMSSGDPKEYTVWLPDAEFARMWAEYCKTGDVTVKAAPPAPTGVTAAAGDKGVSLAWKATAGPESGLKQFAVYRNGEKVATVGSDKAKGNPNGFVQIANYGDEPEPRHPVKAFADAAGKAGDKYEVVSINHAGVGSPKSATAVAK